MELYDKFVDRFEVISKVKNPAVSKAKVYNLGQNVGDNFIKLIKIGFSIECFTADFLRFFNQNRQNLAFG